MKLELSHDILALKIYNKASTEDKMVIKIRNFIKNRFAYFKENKVLLSKDDLDYIRPYVHKVNLDPHELIFIKRSRNMLKVKRFSVGFFILSIIFTIGYFMNRTEKVRSLSEEKLSEELQRYKALEAQARIISDSLVKSREGLHATEEELRIALLEVQKKQDTILLAYATYRAEHNYSESQITKELHIAQSSKLSDLAAAAPNKDKAYAFKLATKAWQLNPQNQQAKDVLYRLNGTPRAAQTTAQTKKIITTKGKTYGQLSRKEMQAIFSSKNEVTISSRKKVTDQLRAATKKPQAALPSSKPIPTQQMEQNIELQLELIQQQIQQQMQPESLPIAPISPEKPK